jgi:hypothetical protein
MFGCLFMKFLGLGLEGRVPDARTTWLFREKLTTAGAIKTLFERFDTTLRRAGYIAMLGQIVDASLIAAPRQRRQSPNRICVRPDVNVAQKQKNICPNRPHPTKRFGRAPWPKVLLGVK